MKFETKLGLVMILMLGSTFSFLLYQKIQERKEEIAQAEQTKSSGEFVNLSPEEQKAGEGTEKSSPSDALEQNKLALKEEKPPFPTLAESSKAPAIVSSFSENRQSANPFQQNQMTQNEPPQTEIVPFSPPAQIAQQEPKPHLEFSQPKESPSPIVIQSEPVIVEQKEPEQMVTPFSATPQTNIVQSPVEQNEAPVIKPFTPLADPFHVAKQNLAQQNPELKNRIEQKMAEQNLAEQSPITFDPLPSKPYGEKTQVKKTPFDLSTAKKELDQFKQQQTEQMPIVENLKEKSPPDFNFGKVEQVDPFQKKAEKSTDQLVEQKPEMVKQEKPVITLTEPAFKTDPFSSTQQNATQQKMTEQITEKSQKQKPVELKPIVEFPTLAEQKTEPPKQKENSSRTWVSQSKPISNHHIANDDRTKQRLPGEPARFQPMEQNEVPLTPFSDQTMANQTTLQPLPKLKVIDPNFTNSQNDSSLANLPTLPPTQRISFSSDRPTDQNRVKLLPSKTKIHIAQPGDNYWKISKRRYGTARYFAALAEFNRPRISNAKKLRPGMKVMIPNQQVLESKYPHYFKNSPSVNSGKIKQVSVTKPAGFFLTRNGQPMYRVGSEDTLGSIAHAHLGRASRWIQIYELNRSKIKTANRLKLGTELQLPRDASKITVLPNSPTIR